jgi:tetratricopeptide (TPR) repeat protein
LVKPILTLSLAASLVALGITPPALSQQAGDSAAAWREDLRFLAVELPRRHKNAFARMTPAQWDSAVRALDSRLPRLARHEMLVELMALLALVGDGHTMLTPEFEERMGFHILPIRLYDFADGLHVIAAARPHADLVGAKVVRIGGVSATEAMSRVGRIVSHESPGWVRYRGPSLLAMPEVLAALGMSDHPGRASFTMQVGGHERTVTLEPAGDAAGSWGRPTPGDWTEMGSGALAEKPLWLRQPGDPFWFVILPDSTLYIRHRNVVFFANGETNEQFFRRAFAAADSAGAQRVVIDLRDNTGGNNFLNRFLVKEIVRRPALDQPHRLLVLIGRGVFSAAQNLVNELDYYTNATFVGEPTGNAPNQYGDARRVELPRSGIRVLISSLLWQGHAAADTRLAFTPDVFGEMSAADYRNGRDVVLETAMRRATGPTLAHRLSAEAGRGDTAAVRLAVRRYSLESENRYRDVEADVNGAGYALLRGGNLPAALAVFQVNAALFPASGNVYDSLGEALERSGRREEAIAAYRRALSLNPNLGSSRDALRRLGTSP